MKNLTQNLLYTFIILLVLSACQKDATTPAEQEAIQPKLKTILHDGVENTRYFYEDDKLIEMEYLSGIVDPITKEVTYEYLKSYFEYEDNRLSRVYSDSRENKIKYEGDDMIIDNFWYSYDSEFVRFKNYKDLQNLEVQYYLEPGYEFYCVPNFNSENDFLNATNENGIDLRESSSGIYKFRNYYGNYTYLEKNHHTKNFDIEVAYFLEGRPFNSCVNIIDYGFRKVSYEYEFNENDYPISSQATSIYENGDTFIHTVLKTYIYE